MRGAVPLPSGGRNGMGADRIIGVSAVGFSATGFSATGFSAAGFSIAIAAVAATGVSATGAGRGATGDAAGGVSAGGFGAGASTALGVSAFTGVSITCKSNRSPCTLGAWWPCSGSVPNFPLSASRFRTTKAASSSIELEWVFFSVTPSSGRRSIIALGFTSSSRASSLIRILLIRWTSADYRRPRLGDYPKLWYQILRLNSLRTLSGFLRRRGMIHHFNRRFRGVNIIFSHSFNGSWRWCF